MRRRDGTSAGSVFWPYEEEAKIDKQKLVIGRLAASGQSTVKAKRDLAGMELALILLRGRVARLSGVVSDDT